MSPTLLFLVNGLGLGNSTRCHAVMQHLAARGATIHVMSSGNGLTYFRDKPEVASLTPMEGLFYSGAHGGISGMRTLLSLARLWRLARTKRQQLEHLLRRLKPDLAIADSEYALGPLRRRGIPIVGLNNSEVVVAEYWRARDMPRSIRGHFWLVEFMDYLYHRSLCDLVISPSPRPLAPRHPKFKRVGLILRQALRDAIPASPRAEFAPPRELRSAVFMLSGSVFASAIPFGKTSLPFAVDVVGRSGADGHNLRFHGKTMNNLDLLKKADILIVNGGFSAMSEAIALNKPTFVIPVRGHAEQYINARSVAELGLGYVAEEATILDQLRRLHTVNRWEGLAPRSPSTGFDGAREAADIVRAFLSGRSGAPGGRPPA